MEHAVISTLNRHILGLAIISAIGYNLVSAQIVKDDPSTWICKNIRITSPELIKAAMDTCKPRPAKCKNLCVFQKLGMLDENFKLDEEKTKSQFGLFLGGTNADEEIKKIIPCGKSLKINDTDVNCAGNHDFLLCARNALAEVCQVPAGSFGYPDE